MYRSNDMFVQRVEVSFKSENVPLLNNVYSVSSRRVFISDKLLYRIVGSLFVAIEDF